MNRVVLFHLVFVFAPGWLQAGEPAAKSQPPAKDPAAIAAISKQQSNLYVLAIGVSAYPTAEMKLKYAAKDAQVLARTFQENSRTLYQSVEVKLLTDKDATRRNILQGLTWLRKQMTQRDTAVVTFAGHGDKDSDGNFYLLPVDTDIKDLVTTAVPGEQVKSLLAGIPGRTLLLLDACHSGAFGSEKRRAGGALTDDLVRDLARDAKEESGVIVMSSSMANEFSLESATAEHGCFTLALVEGLKGKAVAKQDQRVHWHELDDYVTKRVKQLSEGKQHAVTTKPANIRPFPLTRPTKQSAAKYIDVDLGKGVKMKLVYIAPGKFMMGSPKKEEGRFEDEFQHEVELSMGFYMGVHAVTQEEYETVIGKNPSWFSAQGDGKKYVAGMETRRLPVEKVSWNDAQEFCGKLTQKEGKACRLPSEAEWEYACRAGTTTPFHFGETISTDQANYNGGDNGEYRRTTKVDKFAPNPWGLYDMHGNVWQWCEDRYDAKYYENSPKVNPLNENKGQHRVLRGGSWNDVPNYCRSACRYYVEPDYRSSTVIGFRVVFVSP